MTTFNSMSLLYSTATQADLSIWHLILFFGVSLFSHTRLALLRKRIQIFKIGLEGGSWPFASYKQMLRHALDASAIQFIDTISIPDGGSTRVLFKIPQISELDWQ